MNCPASHLGCEKKILATKLNSHMKKCIYNVAKECPNEYCKLPNVPLPKLIEHLVVGDKVPIFMLEKGIPILIPVSDEMQKHDIMRLPDSDYFHWIAAVVQYKSSYAMVVVRQGEIGVQMWLHEIYSLARKDLTDEDPVRPMSSTLTCKLSMKAMDGMGQMGLTFFVRVASPDKSYKHVLQNGSDVLIVPKYVLPKYLLRGTRFDMWQLEVEIEEDSAEDAPAGQENN